jgi:hypothetical protein
VGSECRSKALNNFGGLERFGCGLRVHFGLGG